MGSHKSSSLSSSEIIRSLQADLARQKWAFLPATSTRHLLQDYSGVPEIQDSETLFHSFWDASIPQRDEKGAQVYPFKGTLVSYYHMETRCGREFNVRRSTSHEAPAMLNGKPVCVDLSDESPGEESLPRTIEYADLTTANVESGEESQYRLHKQWPSLADCHPCTRALQRIVFEILSSPSEIQWQPAEGTIRKVSEDGADVYEPQMTAFRVTKKRSNDNTCKKRRIGLAPKESGCTDLEKSKTVCDSIYVAAEPGPEGIHQDLAELTCIFLVNRSNIQPESAGNRVWALDQPCGKPSAEDLQSKRLLKEMVLTERFDALFVLDREVKHEALPIEIGGQGDVAVRDVLTFECRRPRK